MTGGGEVVMSGRDTGGIGTTATTTAGVDADAGGGADSEAATEVAVAHEVVSIAPRCEAAADSAPRVDGAATLVGTLLGEDPHNIICLPVVLRSRIWADLRPWGRRVGWVACRQCSRRPRLRTTA